LREHQGVLEVLRGAYVNAGSGKALHQFIAVAATPIHAQPQRRFGVVGHDDRGDVAGPIMRQRLEQPARVRRARNVIGIERPIQ
jgi:hypothetical protein